MFLVVSRQTEEKISLIGCMKLHNPHVQLYLLLIVTSSQVLRSFAQDFVYLHFYIQFFFTFQSGL